MEKRYFSLRESRWLMALLGLLLSLGCYAQNITVKGIVKDAKFGDPIIGASVLQQGTTNGTITDMDGNFVLDGACATVKAMQIFKFGTPEEDPRCQLTYFTGEVVGPDGKTIYTDWDGQKVPLKYEPLAPKVYMEATDGILVKTAGARMAKYAFDENAQDGGSLHANDCVLFRFADALLMRAEAKIRLGQSGDEEVNLVRNRVGATPLAGVTLDNILDERLLELAFEGVRRQDLIRFGKFTETTVDRYPGVKHSSSSLDWQDDKTGYTTVFSIYADVLSLNPNLRQNYGYENQ